MRLLRLVPRYLLLALSILFSMVLSIVVFFHAYDGLTGVANPYAPQTRLHRQHPELGLEWQMHRVDSPGAWLPNGLDAADVDGDGLEDYVTNYRSTGQPCSGWSGPEIAGLVT